MFNRTQAAVALRRGSNRDKHCMKGASLREHGRRRSQRVSRQSLSWLLFLPAISISDRPFASSP
jgi:hypothetical protein